MARGQKRVNAKSRSEEMESLISSLEHEASAETDGLQFKIKLPKPYRTCHLFDGSIATAIYLRPSGVQGRNGKYTVANKANLSR